MDQREQLIDIFVRYNAQINLSAIRDPHDIRIKHIQDSLELLKIVTLKPGTKVADVGTGGGFPLLPLAIHCPDVSFVGIDARRKKVEVLHKMAGELGLSNVTTQWARAEDVKETFDSVMVRALGLVDKILLWTSHMVKPGGQLIMYKQVSEQEKTLLFSLEKKYDMWLVREHQYCLFQGDIQRVIYVMGKR